MPHSDFVPLHLHTEYSLLDGAIRIDELMETAVKMKLAATAMTDHGNLFGAIEFYTKAVKAGVKPILGCEVYVAPKSRFEKERTGAEDDEHSFHLVLLAQDNDGYRNLVTMVSKAYTEGFYYKPRIDMDLLEQYSGGIIALTSCMKGEIPYNLARGMDDKARDLAMRFKHILGPEHFYIELQDNGMQEQVVLNKKLVELSRELHIGLVATNDCHYLKKEDAHAHEILVCIQTNKTINDPKRMKFNTDSLYFKSPEEMKTAFSELPEAITNTRRIADLCHVELKLGEARLPRFEPPDGIRPSVYLDKLATEGLIKRWGGETPPEAYMNRLKFELGIIKKMGFASYFLIVWDFIKYSKSHGIPVGPGRGSAAGSLVSYSIGITEIDPIRYNLLFERFLNPDRINMPDIDTDFCKDRRGEVISYVSEKYGKDHVAQIITFGTMAAKAAIRDVARALEYPYQEADKLAKLVPETLNIKIDSALKDEPKLKELYDSDPKVKEIIDVARRLEGISRHASTHAAGVVIGPEPLSNIVPLYVNPKDNSVVTQFDMEWLDKTGLVKFDLLGLKTLTVIDKAVKHIKENVPDFDIEKIPLDDKETFDLLSAGLSTGVFQLESSGMRDILTKMHPNMFEDLIALVALYRPGPIGSGMIDDFIKRKKGLTPVEYELKELSEILDETYGVILYQEQVMRIANKLAGFTMGQADALRKAMGKKQQDMMDKFKDTFVKGCVANKINETKSARLFDILAKFAEYGFNKSHSAAYALLTYQTAFLKTHYSVEFMAATMSADLDSTDKIVKSIKECRAMNIEVLPSDINECGVEFKVKGKRIRFGLGAVKGVGASAVELIVEDRTAGGFFKSVEDFIERMEKKKVNKKAVESLIKAGAFDSLQHPEDSLGQARARAMDAMHKGAGGSGRQQDIFGGMEEFEETVAAWDEAELLRNEKEALGFYITGSPMTRFAERLELLDIPTSAGLEERDDREELEFAGIIGAIKKINTKRGDVMAYLTIEDEEGSVDAVLFSDILKNNSEIVKKDMAVMIKGTLEKSDKGYKIQTREIHELEARLTQLSAQQKVGDGKKVEINIKINGNASSVLGELKRVVTGHPGNSTLYLRIHLPDAGREVLILTMTPVSPTRAFTHDVEGVAGKGAVRIT